MTIHRRQFLIGVGASYLLSQAPVTASPAKRAVLIGINQFGILGAVTDVALQRQLLCYRFGFSPTDIFSLTDRQATRSAIEATISQHLWQSTLPGDIAVICFSGCGTLIGDEPALWTADGQIIPYSTLMLWLQAINTDRLLCIIDAGYRYPGTTIVGNLRLRSRPWTGPDRLSPGELSYQEELRTKVPAKKQMGVLLQAADPSQLCAEATWEGFSSGVFTYVLTQNLWQALPTQSIDSILEQVADTLQQWHLEIPNPIGKGLVWQELLGGEPGDGVITNAEGKGGEMWLGGLPLCSLAYSAPGSLVKTASQLLQIKSRNGLTAKVEVVRGASPLAVGTLVQEEVRHIPRNVGLAVAMDSELSRIERVDATSALSSIPRTIGVTAGEQYADCVFGKEEGRYGLFNLGRFPIVDSFGAAGESVTAALKRLRPCFESLLAVKLLHLTLTPNSSYLSFRARVNPQPAISFTPDKQIVGHTLAIGDQLTCHVQSLTDVPLYLRLFCIDSRYRLMSPSFVIPPYASNNVIPPQQTITIPPPTAPITWAVSSPQGYFEILLVVSRKPFSNGIEQGGQSTNGMVIYSNPLGVVLSLLQDLHQGESEDQWVLPLQRWATIGFSYRIV
ncbi:MAG: caspase family protein [Pseudanabaenaceae cyanobacterium SKYGB_i_bin29]|nr:caspase family protein [Pseudanabaenaceae cyanobacterium SKYG29]MDW8420349.1 caspase family protein [Pseudanabaenaceae cyanobacterium SKYGB_i_bin29]